MLRARPRLLAALLLLLLRTAAPYCQVASLAGSLAGSPGATDAVGTAATFKAPSGVALAAGATPALYVADTGNHMIRSIALPSAAVTRVAGSPSAASGFLDGPGTAALLFSPTALVLNGSLLYIADRNNFRLRSWSAASGALATVAGGAAAGGADGACLAGAAFVGPLALAWDGARALYVADVSPSNTAGAVIRQVTAGPGACAVRTLAGAAGTAPANGIGTAATFSRSVALVFMGSGVLWVGDSGNNLLRAIDTASGAVSTLAGSGSRADVDGVALGAGSTAWTACGATARGGRWWRRSMLACCAACRQRWQWRGWPLRAPAGRAMARAPAPR